MLFKNEENLKKYTARDDSFYVTNPLLLTVTE